MTGKADRKEKKVTPGYLERAALFYLERYSSSTRNLERVLDRKVRRRHEDGRPPSEEERQWIKEAADKCAKMGYVDDRRYATQKAISMALSGKAERAISQYLRSKGVSGGDIDHALQAVAAERGDDHALKAAIIYARKRGFGPFRMRAADDDRRQKDIAAMLRAGHKMDHAMQVIKAPSKEGLEDILYS